MKTCKHCWHTQDTVHQINGTQYKEICCQCGETKESFIPYDNTAYTNNPKKHGPFIPIITSIKFGSQKGLSYNGS